MAKPTIQTGANSTVFYYWEDGGFNEDPDESEEKTYGRDVSLQAFQGSRNVVELFQPNDRDVEKYLKQQFSGTIAVQFVLANPWWLRGVIDTPATSGGGPYTHTYDGLQPSSQQVVVGNTRSGRDYEAGGVFWRNCSVEARVPGNITATLRGAYSSLEDADVSNQNAQPPENDDFKGFTFADGSMQVGDPASTRHRIQSISLRIEQGTDPVFEFGNENAVGFSPKARRLTLEHAQLANDTRDEGMERFLGGSSLSDPSEDKIEIVARAAANDEIKFELTDCFPADFNLNGLGDPTTDIANQLTDRPVSVKAVATNPVDTAP